MTGRVLPSAPSSSRTSCPWSSSFNVKHAKEARLEPQHRCRILPPPVFPNFLQTPVMGAKYSLDRTLMPPSAFRPHSTGVRSKSDDVSTFQGGDSRPCKMSERLRKETCATVKLHDHLLAPHVLFLVHPCRLSSHYLLGDFALQNPKETRYVPFVGTTANALRTLMTFLPHRPCSLTECAEIQCAYTKLPQT
ncbi:hypothetical protein OH77DRAFT_1116353 [Trametes cingulata]|nr:hypothetical protein OH77DRAFT_1116353 [Trametes cingulata]